MNVRRRLIRERNRLIEEVSTGSTRAEGAELDEKLRWIKNYDKLIKYVTPTYGPGLHASAVALLCITTVGVAWTWPVSSSRVIVDVEAEAVAMRLTDAWEWRQLPAKQHALRLEQMTVVEVPAQGINRAPPSPLTGRPWIDVEDGQISMDGLSLERNALLRLHQADDGFVYIQTLGAPLRGHFSLLGGALEIEAGREPNQKDAAYSIERSIPESLVFASDGAGIVPSTLRIRPEQPLVLAGFTVGELSFSRQVSEKPGHTQFACTIKSGTLRFSDTERDFILKRGDCLSMSGERGRVVQITIDNALQLNFEGEAKQVEIGPEGFQRDITPNYLEWLFHNQRLSFLWGAVVFLWGMLWSARRMLLA